LIVSQWDALAADDRTAYWSKLSREARMLLYMKYDGKVGIL